MSGGRSLIHTAEERLRSLKRLNALELKLLVGAPFYPLHQNVMFTFCLSLLCLMLLALFVP